MCKAQEVRLFFHVISVNHDLLYFNIGVLIAIICCKNNTNDFVFTQRLGDCELSVDFQLVLRRDKKCSRELQTAKPNHLITALLRTRSDDL